MMIREKKWILILLGIIAVLIVGILLTNSLLKSEDASSGGANTNTELPPLSEGEAYSGDGKLLMLYASIPTESIQSILVKNQTGSYTIARGKTEETKSGFFIDDKAYLQNGLYATTLASIRVAVGTPTVLSRVATDCADMSKYGLRGKDSEQGYYTVTTTAGKSITVCIGNRTVSGGGYYAAVEGREGHVYVLDGEYLSTTILLAKEELVTPYIGYPTNQNDYYRITEFSLAAYNRKPGIPENEVKQFMAVVDFNPKYEEEDQKDYTGISKPYTLRWPAGYEANVNNVQSIYTLFQEFTGDKVVFMGPNNYLYDDQKQAEDGASQEEQDKMAAEAEADRLFLAQYGLDSASRLYDLYYKYPVTEKGDDGKVYTYYIVTWVHFGEKNDTQYAYSTIHYEEEDGTIFQLASQLICEVDFDDFPFLSWDKSKFVQSAVYQADVSNVKEITLDKGTEFEETFYLNYVASTIASKKGELVLKSVTIKSTGEVIDGHIYCTECGKEKTAAAYTTNWPCSSCGFYNKGATCVDGETGKLYNFRTFYSIILGMRLMGSVPETTKDPATGAYVATSTLLGGAPDYTLTVVFKTGQVQHYAFRRISALQSAMTRTIYNTVDDFAANKNAVSTTTNEFCLYTSQLDKIIADAKLVCANTAVSADAVA